MLTANFPAEDHKLISDDWLGGDWAAVAGDTTYGVDASGRHYVHCHRKWIASQDAERDMSPRMISVASDSGQGTYSGVSGFLWAQNEGEADVHPVPVGGVLHSLRFKRIYAEGTTARGIRIYG